MPNFFYLRIRMRVISVSEKRVVKTTQKTVLPYRQNLNVKMTGLPIQTCGHVQQLIPHAVRHL